MMTISHEELKKFKKLLELSEQKTGLKLNRQNEKVFFEKLETDHRWRIAINLFKKLYSKLDKTDLSSILQDEKAPKNG